MLPKQYRNFTEHQAEFTAFLQNSKFDTFATFTTAKELSLAGSRRLAERFYSRFVPKAMFWAAEPFSIRTGYHFHALINSEYANGKGEYHRSMYFDYWVKEKKIGRADFQKISEGENWTNHYVTKYISKGLSDYDYFTPQHNAARPEIISKYPKELILPIAKRAERTDILQRLTEKHAKNAYSQRRNHKRP